MKSLAVGLVLGLVMGLSSTPVHALLTPQVRVKLVDGHLSSWQTALSPGMGTLVSLWGRDGGWATGALQWGPVLLGPLRAVREDAVPWDFRPDPSAPPGTWGAVIGAERPVSCWWVQTPAAVLLGAQAAWKTPLFLASGGVEWDLLLVRPLVRGLVRLGGPEGRATVWYDGARIGVRAESERDQVKWSATWDGDPQTGTTGWRFRGAVDDVSLELSGTLQDHVLGGKALLGWSHGPLLGEAAFARSPEGHCSVEGTLQGGWGNLLLSGAGKIPVGQAPAGKAPWSCDVGLTWTVETSEWSAGVKTESTVGSRELPSGTFRATVRDLARPWKASLELKAPARVAQWVGAGNHVTLEVSTGF